MAFDFQTTPAPLQPKTVTDNIAQFYKRMDVLEVPVFGNDTGTGVRYGATPLQTIDTGGPLGSGLCWFTQGRYYHTVQLSGDSTGISVTIDVSLDGVTWFSPVTLAATGITTFVGQYKVMRATIATNSGGTKGLTLLYNGRA